MATLLTDVPERAPADLNQDSDTGAPVVRQDNLCALLKLGNKIASSLDEGKMLGHSDALRLLELARGLLLFVDVPAASLGTNDDSTPTKLQGLVLESVALAEKAEQALSLRELALLAAAPYAIERYTSRSEPDIFSAKEGPPLSAASALQAVVGRAQTAFSLQLARADYLQSSGEIAIAAGKSVSVSLPTLRALGVAAVDRLGAALCSEAGDAPLLQLLLDGGWQDAVAAMGLHMVHPLTAASSAGGAARGSEWFVRAVPLGMLRLRDDLDRSAEKKATAVSDALEQSWTAVGTALAHALGMTSDDNGAVQPSGGNGGAQQIRMLDAVVQASLAYVTPKDAQKKQPFDECPMEMGEYWGQLVRVLERGARTASEPVVLEQCDADGPLAAPDAWRRQLALACFRWLFHMSALSDAKTEVAGSSSVAPLWVARAAAPALVRQCRAVLQSFVADK
ncbi:hypothetical protein J3B02_005446, partial [Coemansia erecta]